MTMKKTTICLADADRKVLDALMKKYNFSSWGQVVRYAIQFLSTHDAKK